MSLYHPDRENTTVNKVVVNEEELPATSDKPDQSNALIRSSTSISLSQLDDLINGVVLAIRVPGFVSEPKKLAESIREINGWGSYSNIPELKRVGIAFHETENRADILLKYQAEAIHLIRRVRSACNPYLSPIDQLRLELDEIWPGGAGLAKLDNHKMFSGLARIIDSEGAEPHVDILADHAKGRFDSTSLTTQLAANAYLSIPKSGGELELWREALSVEEIPKYIRIGSCYGLDREKIPPPTVEFKPSRGELVIFNSTKIHAVKPVIEGERMTLSTFIGVRRINTALTLWS